MCTAPRNFFTGLALGAIHFVMGLAIGTGIVGFVAACIYLTEYVVMLGLGVGLLAVLICPDGTGTSAFGRAYEHVAYWCHLMYHWPERRRVRQEIRGLQAAIMVCPVQVQHTTWWSRDMVQTSRHTNPEFIHLSLELERKYRQLEEAS